MTAVEQPCYTLINLPSDSDPPNEMQLKLDLEKGDVKIKIEALKKTIQMIASGERLPGLLMTIIRFVLPLQDHMIKKLLLIFWEIVPKTTQDGKLMQEMILVCDSYRKDLQHPNEFLRGSTLRFLCKLKEPELLEPLMPAIRVCLEHRHSYVRRNAILAIFTIYRNFEFLIPDAPELIANFLEGEQDMSCKRNAFLMLLHADQERALSYLASCLDQVTSFGDILQLVIVELIYKVSLIEVQSPGDIDFQASISWVQWMGVGKGDGGENIGGFWGGQGVKLVTLRAEGGNRIAVGGRGTVPATRSRSGRQENRPSNTELWWEAGEPSRQHGVAVGGRG
uniref:Clathrin/coatomer adaptor adaptin-like N-terminal domain-containing protein n=1 Tax=Timema monikensis TaxID=170555 RepID=A0A7R9E3C4_9NEOP|nr:unnamed protein product [Timema monikensis]